ncbi:MAG: cryptochrome/photolyase family protein [Sphingomonadales bacterium]|nr:cryptochrome/photolyase family protein [Sphingomonadales bacterium]
MDVFIVFPHQLFKDIIPLKQVARVFIIEEYLFFKQYSFHKQKIALHRASMQYYKHWLKSNGIETKYLESTTPLSDIRNFISEKNQYKISSITCYDPCDNWLSMRLQNSSIPVTYLASPSFLNDADIPLPTRKDGSIVQTDFYVAQRKQRNILMDNGKPVGGQWTYDTDNRKRYPKGQTPPPLLFPDENEFTREAISYTEQHFPNNPGSLTEKFIYSVNHTDTEKWLQHFLSHRFHDFGPYEDALVQKQHWLHHSVLTPMLNSGLLTPQQIIDAAIEYSDKHPIPLASLEGFIRQIIGWREFIRLFYLNHGTEQRNRNFWGFTRKIPASFYTGTTGILPIDDCIQKLLKTGYNHHIERLMVLGNFMLLCEFDPVEVYRWFMEMYIDAYDWVMVPNVYGMSQFADGGRMCSKPYISGSNYLLKMSDYKGDGRWEKIWDGLFWSFMHKQRDFFGQNPRIGMLLKALDNMDAEKRQQHFDVADNFLKNLDA